MASMTLADEVASRLAALRARIESSSPEPAKVRIVAVTKGQPAGALEAALAAGITDIGENRAQELLAKTASVNSEVTPRWHFLGKVQTNKVSKLIPLVHLWQSIDTVRAGEAVAKREHNARVLVQVDHLGGRQGAAPAEVERLVRSLRDLGLKVEGLMTMGSEGDAKRTREVFRETARLAADLALRELSMGMTDDLDLALEEGSTIVRIGRGLFGPRSGAAEVRR